MKTFAVVLLALVCLSAVMAGYPRSYHSSGYKTYLGGAHYGGYRPLRYHGHYAKPVVHHSAPVVYAKSYAKPHVTHYVKPHVTHYVKPQVAHYVKPAYHHSAPVYHKPAYYLGGYSHGSGLVYSKPISHGYAHAPAVVYAKSYHH